MLSRILHIAAYCLLSAIMLTACRQGGNRHDAAAEETAHKYYLKGVESLDSGNYAGAVNNALLSLEKTAGSPDSKLKAKTHELLADAYRSVYNLKAARSHRTEAARIYRNTGFDKNAFYATMDLAGEYSHEDNDSAYAIMENARSISDGSATELSHYNLIFSDISRVKNDYRKALSHLRAIDKDSLRNLATAADSVHIGEIYFHNEMTDSAFIFFATDASRNDVQYWECMAMWHERKGDSDKTLECLRNMMNLGNDKADTSLSNALESVEKSFYQRKAFEEQKKSRRLTIAIVSIALAIVVCSLILLLFRYYRKAKKLHAENLIKDVVIMSGDNDVQPIAVQEITETPISGAAVEAPAEVNNEKWINVILDFYMERLNKISRQYFKASDEEAQHEIEAEFEKELRSIRNGDIFEEIERRINERNDDIVKKIRREFPKFNEQYVRLMICSLAGLSSQSTCLLLSIEKGNYYMAWTRIRDRIRKSETESHDLFMTLFCKK